MAFVQSIAVVDANGEELTVFEFQDRRFLKKVRRLKLDTGEVVEQLDSETFAIVRTGERLTRVT